MMGTTAASTTMTFSLKTVSEECRHMPSKVSSTHEKSTGDRVSKFVSSSSKIIRFLCSIIRLIAFDGALAVLFAVLVFSVVLHKLHDDYLHPQLQLMLWNAENRQFTDNTYYHRVCEENDFTATSPEELIIEDHFSTEDSVELMLTHGVSVYPNLLTNETATTLRDWIVVENHRREGWNVIGSQNRYTWGIDMNMHPTLQTFWQELAANEKLMNGVEAIVGSNPAIIEFTAITSSYGAEDQYMHADVIASASAVKYARSFVPSYSLFVPLQDTTYEMGATHVCPGSHLCSEAHDPCEEHGAFAVSGEGIWAMGSGAFLNQQTFHRGMGYTQKGGIDRVVLIATFASRPNYRLGLETRMIGQGGSYSLIWHQWGHTLSDYVHSDKRMTEPQKTFRSLGLIKGNGWNYLSSLSMRMANEDTGMSSEHLEELLEEEGGLWFLPRSWQDVNEESDISDYHAFAIGVLKRVEFEFKRFYFVGLGAYVLIFSFFVMLQRSFGFGNASIQSKLSIAVRFLLRIVATHGVIVVIAWFALNTVEDSYWAKSIRSRKSYRIPVSEVDNPAPSTVPTRDDILFVSHYSSDYLASYARIVDFAHPGNSHWKAITKRYAAPYAALTQSLKQEFCTYLVLDVTSERRFLKQDEERFWTEVIEINELINTCHRDLTTAYDPLLEKLIFKVDSLQSETKFGKFRGTVMQVKTMPDYLQRWDNRILGNGLKNSTRTGLFSAKSKQSKKRTTLEKAIYSATRLKSFAMTRNLLLPSSRPALPQQPLRTEPFHGAWLQEGDRIECLFRCNHENGRWFPGTITAAIPNSGTYDVLYDDGDVDEDISLECIERLV